MTIRTSLKQTIDWIRQEYYMAQFPSSTLGSSTWLCGAELRYGGRVTGIKRNKVSPKNPRSTAELNRGGMTGGDRMLHHNYAIHYAENLRPFIRRDDITLVEIGILKGTGLAIWCDLFPKGSIWGLDIDLSHIKENMMALHQLGAFSTNRPQLFEYDQLQDNTAFWDNILEDTNIDICIDDGLHSDESVLLTLSSVLPHLNDDFVYFIEDNKNVHKTIQRAYPEFRITHHGELTIITPREC